MTIEALSGETVWLAGADEIRMVGSTTEAERELAGGFRAAAVLLGSGASDAAAAELARRLSAHPDGPAIPVLAVSGDGDRLRLTCLSDVLRLPAGEEELSGLLEVLERLCAVPQRLAG